MLFLSTSIFMTLSLPLYCSATASTTGASARQGPHHAAQKSTNTGVSDCKTFCSNSASFTSDTNSPAISLISSGLAAVSAVHTICRLSNPHHHRCPTVENDASCLQEG